ncbi:MAG: chromosomal replication initiator protein DnaA [Chloroflexi bacterium]|nr:chromosomal replication initiator protein DnaA [Chloroflexota bacterium]MBI3733293.1 chromosomal replication initiator protein DnaA [Chloroflexota bacterium]
MDAHEVWKTVLGSLEMQMTRATFDTWIKNTSVVSYEDGQFVIGVPNTYAVEWIENRLHGVIQRIAGNTMRRSVDFRFVVKPPSLRDNGALPLHDRDEEDERPEPVMTMQPTAVLNPKYVFEMFIVGANNRLAHAAALAVANNPAHAYNPLFIYGGVGLGKTHLLHAIGHVAQRTALHVTYVSSEKFTNDLINSIRSQNTEEFRRIYRNTDILLIDDIQFIAGKESTQEEFFHTFNSLQADNKQIVMTSDRAPKAIQTLEERLRSRFEGGMIADIQAPDLETRIAILRFKAESLSIKVPSEVLTHIAQRVQSNIRELEGALTRVVGRAELLNQPLTMDLAVSALEDVLAYRGVHTVDDVVVAVAKFYHLDPEQLRGRDRSKEVAYARQIAMYLAREETDTSLPQIGAALGGRDHTTVMYGYDKIAAQIESDEQMRREVLTIKGMLFNTRERATG